MAQDLPPVPYKTPIVDLSADGTLTPVWSDWFRKAFNRMGGNLAPSQKSATGYQKLSNGLYIQWGQTGSVASATVQAVTFPTVFPNACFQVVAGIISNASGSPTATGHFGTGTYTTKGFNLNNQTSAAYSFNWVAIGY